MLRIHDLTEDKSLDSKAMSAVCGGFISNSGFGQSFLMGSSVSNQYFDISVASYTDIDHMTGLDIGALTRFDSDAISHAAQFA